MMMKLQWALVGSHGANAMALEDSQSSKFKWTAHAEKGLVVLVKACPNFDAVSKNIIASLVDLEKYVGAALTGDSLRDIERVCSKAVTRKGHKADSFKQLRADLDKAEGSQQAGNDYDDMRLHAAVYVLERSSQFIDTMHEMVYINY